MKLVILNIINDNIEPSLRRNSMEGVETTKVFQNGRQVGYSEEILNKQRGALNTFIKVKI